MSKKLILVRGLPGSGKSTFAKTLNAKHLEADMYFERDGKYEFKREELKDAHEWCQAETRKALREGDVVVSNTFVRLWEMQVYLDIAEELNATPTILVVEGDHESIHAPKEIVEAMKARWQPYTK